MTRSILDELSSQRGDRTEDSNRKVVLRVLGEPHLLVEIAGRLTGESAALAGDCAEVLTKVPEERPTWIAPYAAAPAAVHQDTLQYLESLTVDDTEKVITVPWGETIPLPWIIRHVVEHEIHHRGELSLILGMFGREGLDV